jgi:hypothetical protein
MSKKAACLLLVLLLCVLPARAGYNDEDDDTMNARPAASEPSPSPAARPEVQVRVEGRPLHLAVNPVFKDKCFVPIRALAEALGATVAIDGARVEVEGFGVHSSFTVGKGDNNATVTGNIRLTAPIVPAPFTQKGDVMVPIGSFSLLTGISATWDLKTFTVSITRPQTVAQNPPGQRDLIATKAAPSVQAPGPGRRFALLIGISRYASPEINPLRFTLNDVEAVRKALVEVGGYPPDHVRVLSDRGPADLGPTKVNIEIGMNWLAAMASKPEDTVFVYFSGHGTSDANGAYLVTEETRLEALLSSALNISDFNKMVGGIRAGKKIIVLDACHSGGMDVAARGGDRMSGQLKARLLAESERAVGDVRFLSCKEDELSFEDDARGVQQGVFSFYLVKGMRGEADSDGDGLVTFPELDAYVTSKVVEWAALKGRRQTPTSDGKRSGTIVMSRVR